MTPCYNYSRRPALNTHAESLDLLWCSIYSEPPTKHLFLDQPSSFSAIRGRPRCYIQTTDIGALTETTQACFVGSDLFNLMSSLLLAKPAIGVVANHGYRCLLLPTPTIHDHTPNYCWFCQMTSGRIGVLRLRSCVADHRAITTSYWLWFSQLHCGFLNLIKLFELSDQFDGFWIDHGFDVGYGIKMHHPRTWKWESLTIFASLWLHCMCFVHMLRVVFHSRCSLNNQCFLGKWQMMGCLDLCKIKGVTRSWPFHIWRLFLIGPLCDVIGPSMAIVCTPAGTCDLPSADAVNSSRRLWLSSNNTPTENFLFFRIYCHQALNLNAPTMTAEGKII